MTPPSPVPPKRTEKITPVVRGQYGGMVLFVTKMAMLAMGLATRAPSRIDHCSPETLLLLDGVVDRRGWVVFVDRRGWMVL